MALFDSIINKTSNKFDLDRDKTENLFAALSELITAEKTGGFEGFIERFNQVGLDDAAASWITTGDNAEISDAELNSAIGADTVSVISERVNISKEKISAALAFMVPGVVDRLTPDGRIPDDKTLRSELAAYHAAETTGADKNNDAVDAVGDAAEAVGEEISDVFESVGKRVDVEDEEGESILKWFAPLFILSIFIVIGFYACSDHKGKPALHKDSIGKPVIQNEKTEDAH